MRNPLRQKLKNRQSTYGIWITLESPNITEMAVTLGCDWVVIDMEHGHLEVREVLEHVRAVRGSETAAIVRIPEVQLGTVKRVLDTGAHGVILPMISSGEDLERAFRLGRYPPRGIRGLGAERAAQWGLSMAEYLRTANEETLLIPLIETRAAVKNIQDILALPGLEALFFGPSDLSASYGQLGQWDEPPVGEAIQNVRAQASAQGITCGILARTSQELRQRREEGFGMIALGSDMSLMIRALRESLSLVERAKPPGY